MDRTFLAAIALTLASLVGYVAGVAAPYPGREVSIAGLLIGVTLAAVTYGRNGGGTVTGGGAPRSDGGDATTRTAATNESDRP
ncbi:hypothetical protein [Halobaculum marinum]|uniref:XapX domain-containing protein n=1 Tax=Halobaculum marinum TaxID=3031996 RepID=A0ABD5WYH3_9EURY|nr:hypothetical protein [Halobaculum sp. DT55]